MISNLSAQQLRQAASIKDRIDALQTELEKLFGESTKLAQEAPKGRREMSASARAKIGAAQKARWAKANGKTATKPVKTGRRKMSAAGRARIAAAAKARWAKAKAAGKNSL
jgi:CelD/BcsL family acetyltransferase involved in cellulose biosynthesis